MVDKMNEGSASPAERELQVFSEEITQKGGSIDMYRRLVQIADSASERVATMARDLQSKVVESFSKRPESIGILSAAFLSMFLATNAGDAQERKDLPSVLQIVVPFPAGGPSDAVARTLAEALKGQLPAGVTPIVVNRPGAGGIVAAQSVSNSSPSGRELLFFNSGFTNAEHNENFPRQLSPRNMIPVGLINQGGLVLVASKDFPGSTVDEFLQWLIDNKKSLAHGGFGSPSYVCTLQLVARAKGPINQVSYQGAGQALRDVMGRHVDGLCALTADASQQIASGNVKPLALTRPTDGIDVTTFAQQGHPEVDATVMNALAFPAGTPDEMVQQLTRALLEIRKSPSFNEASLRFGLTVVPVGDADTVATARAAQAKWYLDELTKLSNLLGKPVPPQQ